MHSETAARSFADGPGIPGRVLLGVGALTTVIASGNVGAVLGRSAAGQRFLRELDAHELKNFNTLCAVQELPENRSQALKVVGNCEPPRMAQAMAKGVIGPVIAQVILGQGCYFQSLFFKNLLHNNNIN